MLRELLLGIGGVVLAFIFAFALLIVCIILLAFFVEGLDIVLEFVRSILA